MYSEPKTSAILITDDNVWDIIIGTQATRYLTHHIGEYLVWRPHLKTNQYSVISAEKFNQQFRPVEEDLTDFAQLFVVKAK